MQVVEISSDYSGTISLREQVARLSVQLSGRGIEVRSLPAQFRAPDASVTIGLVSASASVITAVVAGVLAIAQSRNARRIVITRRDGTRIEVPADCTNEQIEQYLSLAEREAPMKIFIDSGS